MKQSLSDTITDQFYEWEKRGRGWFVAPVPIDLEPPHHPFIFFHSNDTYKDDGKRPTILSRFADFFRTKAPFIENINAPDYSSIELYPYKADASLYVLKLVFPKEVSYGTLEGEQLLLMLSYAKHPISFEIVATHTSIAIQYTVREADVEYVKSQLKVFFPKCIIEETIVDHEDLVFPGLETLTVDLGLKEEFMRPIATLQHAKLDPYTSLFGSMDRLQPGEQAVVQVLFSGTVNNWSKTIIESVTDHKGQSFFADAPEMPHLAKEKIYSPLFAVTVRCIVQSPDANRVNILFPHICIPLLTLSRSNTNALIPLAGNEYDFDERVEDIQKRTSRRMGMLLNCKELLNLVHIPFNVSVEKFKRVTKKTKAFFVQHQEGISIGVNTNSGVETNVVVSNAERLTHTHIIGATGTGKSTLLLSLIQQDLLQGNGLGVLDPHGDLIEQILLLVPSYRKHDVVIIDPSDASFPVGLNLLQANSEVEKEVLASDLVASFRKHSTSWGDQMNSVLGNAIVAFLESTKGGTLLDLRRFLLEKEFRETFLKTVSDSHIHYYWHKQFPILKSNSVGPILTRLDSFLRPKLIRNMVGQKKGLDFESLIDAKKIILIKLSQGLIGEENSYLLGSFLVTKIHQAAMARQGKSKNERNDFFLYIDEFQNFATPSMSSILSGARKYHLGLVLAHQDMQQLQKADAELASSVLSNAGTRICFRLGDTDARTFEKGFSYFDATDLQQLSRGEAIGRIGRSDNDFSMQVQLVTIPTGEEVEKQKEEIITLSRTKYALIQEEKEEVETETEIVSDPFKKDKAVTVPIQDKITEPQKELKEISSVEDDNVQQKKEETQHRYLQTLIKKMAESKGYKATLEALTADGKGRVDVAIERNDIRIACEVSVTTDIEWELHNIEKCIASGYGVVVSCVAHKKSKQLFQEKIKNYFPLQQQECIKIFEPEELFLYLDSIAQPPEQTINTIKGYRVKVQYDSLSQEEINRKKDLIAKVMVGSFKRLKK